MLDDLGLAVPSACSFDVSFASDCISNVGVLCEIGSLGDNCESLFLGGIGSDLFFGGSAFPVKFDCTMEML